MKVLHVIIGLGNGGAEGVLTRLCLNSFKTEHEVISLTGLGFYGHTLIASGIKVHCLDIGYSPRTWINIFKIIGILKKNKESVVQTWMYHADLVGGVIAKIIGIKKIYWCIRHSELKPETTKKTTILIAKICALLSFVIPSKIICCSKKALKTHENIGYCSSKMIYVPNGYDLKLFYPDSNKRKEIRQELSIEEDVFLIGNVGRYHPDKDHENLLKSLFFLKKMDCKFVCILVGSGLNDPNLIECIQKNYLEDVIISYGVNNNIPLILNGLDLFVLSSKTEGFPNTLAEAMSSQINCVTTDVGDAALILNHDDCVVEAEQPQKLANAIFNMINECNNKPDLWTARKKLNRTRIKENFSIESMVNEYENIWYQ